MVSEVSVLTFIPLAQTLLTVVHCASSWPPAPFQACLAGACPTPALTTFPRVTSTMSEALKVEVEEREASWWEIVEEAKAGAEIEEREPLNGAMAVRAKDTITGLGVFGAGGWRLSW